MSSARCQPTGFMAPCLRMAFYLLFGSAVLVVLAGCSRGGAAGVDPSRLQVVATTTIVGDVVQKVGGDAVQVQVLLPSGTDPHSFSPSPRDLIQVSDADLVFVNGAGLETFLGSLVENAARSPQQTARETVAGEGGGRPVPIISLSEGLALRTLQEEHAQAEGGDSAAHNGQGVDPHVWFDPANVRQWVKRIQAELSAADPVHADLYAANAQAYLGELEGLEGWIEEQVSQILPEKRLLVMDHTTLGYFADRYGFQLVGAVIPSFSAGAAPSATELAALEDSIRKLRAPAIFVGTTVSPDLAERVAADSGIPLVRLYTDSLTKAGGEASSYMDLMRYDVKAIVEALK